MASKNRKVYTPGCEDVERVIEHLANEEKKARRAMWLRDYYSKSNKDPQKQKEDGNENNS